MPDLCMWSWKSTLENCMAFFRQIVDYCHLTKSYLHHEMTRGAEKAGVKRIRIHDLETFPMFRCLSAWDFQRYLLETE